MFATARREVLESPSLTTPPAEPSAATNIAAHASPSVTPAANAQRLERRNPPVFSGKILNPKDPKNAGWATIPIKVLPSTGPILLTPIPVVINPKNAPTPVTTTKKKAAPSPKSTSKK
jgi:hypothetical protein